MSTNQALELDWSFGFSGHLLNLSTARHKTIFYAAGNTGVIYDLETSQQRSLLGHRNLITAVSISRDKRWLVTADTGADAIMIVWDTLNGNAVKTFPLPHGPDVGIIAIDMSHDSGYLVTLSSELPQTLSVWDWTAETANPEPVHTAEIDSKDLQHFVKFNTEDPSFIVSNGSQDVFFWEWNEEAIRCSVANIHSASLAKASTMLTQSVFVPAAETVGNSKGGTGSSSSMMGMNGEEDNHDEMFGAGGGTHGGEAGKEDGDGDGVDGFDGGEEGRKIPHFDVLTGTSDGDVVLWQRPRFSTSEEDQHRYQVAKMVRLHETAINVLTTVNNYIVTGGNEGFIRFYDYQFRLLAWFENLSLPRIRNIAFEYFVPRQSGANHQQNKTLTRQSSRSTKEEEEPEAKDEDAFDAPNLIAASDTDVIMVPASLFEEVESEYRRAEIILEGHDGAIAGLDTHPIVPVLAIAGHLCGPIQLWDYERRELIHSWIPGGTKRKRGVHLNPVCIKFDPSGELLAVAFQDGGMKLLTTNSFEIVKSFKGQEEGRRYVAEQIVFSHDGTYFASANDDLSVAIYHLEEVIKRDPELGEEYRVLDWIYLGRYKSHYKEITGLLFSKGDSGDKGAGETRLLSIGSDRFLVEYDLAESSLIGGIKLKSRTRLEKTAVPTAVCMHPHTSKEDFVLTANNEYKFKMYNTNNKMARRTVLGPTFGGPLRQMLMLPLPEDRKYLEDQPQYMVYATEERVIGMVKFPLDGNPNKSMGMIAHPGPIGMGICCSNDGRYLFTSGVTDRVVNMWAIETAALDQQEMEGGEGLEPYISLIEGGKHGDFYQEMHEYFYYAQLQAQGENTTGTRKITNKLGLSEIPNLMRALGYYPTEKEILDMHNEVKYDQFVESGEFVESVTFQEFLKLYVNHRPVLGIGSKEVEDMLNIIGGGEETGEIDRDRLFSMIMGSGEVMTEMEVRKCLQRLLPEDNPQVSSLPSTITADYLAANVLGFEEVEGDADEME